MYHTTIKFFKCFNVILKKLRNGKVSGHDQIGPQQLKNLESEQVKKTRKVEMDLAIMAGQ